MPDFGASTHWLPAGRVAPLGDADAVADADADADAEPPAEAEPASVDGEPPHPDSGQGGDGSRDGSGGWCVTKDLMALLPSWRGSPSLRTR